VIALGLFDRHDDLSTDPTFYWFRLMDRLGHTEGRLDSAMVPLVDSLVRRMASAPRYETYWTAYGLYFPAAQVELNRRVLQLPLAGNVASGYRWGIALAWAARGAWDSAQVAMDQYMNRSSNKVAAVHRYRLAVVGAWVGAVDTLEAVKRRAAAVQAIERLAADSSVLARQAELAWLDGVLALARGDQAALSSALEAARRTRAAVAPYFVRSLDAFSLALAGDQRSAGRALAALEWHRVDFDSGGSDAGPYLAAIDRLAGARWLVTVGDTTQAARLLCWVEPMGTSPEDRVMAGLAYLERARIEDAQGRGQLAREHYEQFLRRYDMPVPAQRHLVEEAQAALHRLRSQSDEAEPAKP
jgi:hypothetical protein